ncbi:hypothetical protein FQA47_007664 [Oryzias melastigma]|uniref:Uncharacterized protein n=1 Tax=Oryzias melastigma TaxID=30732 RepID=A0A834C7R2_ORYME|nr:hypothetical protein FQA47_007664 [Oryzias melastigma]
MPHTSTTSCTTQFRGSPLPPSYLCHTVLLFCTQQPHGATPTRFAKQSSASGTAQPAVIALRQSRAVRSTTPLPLTLFKCHIGHFVAQKRSGDRAAARAPM